MRTAKRVVSSYKPTNLASRFLLSIWFVYVERKTDEDWGSLNIV